MSYDSYLLKNQNKDGLENTAATIANENNATNIDTIVKHYHFVKKQINDINEIIEKTRIKREHSFNYAAKTTY